MENVFTAVEPFVRFANIFGIFPMSFAGPVRKGSLRVKKIDIAISSISIAVVSYMTIFNHRITVGSSSMLLKFAWHFSFGAQYVGSTFLMFYSIFKRKNVVRFLKQIHDIDEKVKFLHRIVTSWW
jgi:7tm Chemosensory receptor